MKSFLVLVVIATTSVTSRYVHKSRHQLRSTAANTDTLSSSETSTSTPQTHITQTEADGTTSFQPPSDPSELQGVARSAHGPNKMPVFESRDVTCTKGYNNGYCRCKKGWGLNELKRNGKSCCQVHRAFCDSIA